MDTRKERKKKLSNTARANKSWAIKVHRLNWKICRIFSCNFYRPTAYSA